MNAQATASTEKNAIARSLRSSAPSTRRGPPPLRAASSRPISALDFRTLSPTTSIPSGITIRPLRNISTISIPGCRTRQDGRGKPFLVTEIGAGGLYGYRTPYASKWSEEYQQQTLEEQLTGVLSHPACSGVYIWQFSDIRISEEWWGTRPRTMNNKGVVDEYRRPKLCYEDGEAHL